MYFYFLFFHKIVVKIIDNFNKLFLIYFKALINDPIEEIRRIHLRQQFSQTPPIPAPRRSRMNGVSYANQSIVLSSNQMINANQCKQCNCSDWLSNFIAGNNNKAKLLIENDIEINGCTDMNAGDQPGIGVDGSSDGNGSIQVNHNYKLDLLTGNELNQIESNDKTNPTSQMINSHEELTSVFTPILNHIDNDKMDQIKMINDNGSSDAHNRESHDHMKVNNKPFILLIFIFFFSILFI